MVITSNADTGHIIKISTRRCALIGFCLGFFGIALWMNGLTILEIIGEAIFFVGTAFFFVAFARVLGPRRRHSYAHFHKDSPYSSSKGEVPLPREHRVQAVEERGGDEVGAAGGDEQAAIDANRGSHGNDTLVKG
jgi:hypothetical protein